MGTRSDNDGMSDRKNCENINIINNLGLKQKLYYFKLYHNLVNDSGIFIEKSEVLVLFSVGCACLRYADIVERLQVYLKILKKYNITVSLRHFFLDFDFYLKYLKYE